MLCCGGRNTDDDPNVDINRRNSKIIDKELFREKKTRGRQIKILLLGAGESGKSTFLKQMRIIHGEEYSQKDLMEFKTLIYGNVVKNMRVLITARDSFGIKWANPDYEDYAQELLSINTKSTVFDYATFMDYSGKIVDLWTDRAIQETYDKRNLYQLVMYLIYQSTLATPLQYKLESLFFYIN